MTTEREKARDRGKGYGEEEGASVCVGFCMRMFKSALLSLHAETAQN